MDRATTKLFQDVPIDFLIIYRIAFGLVMCWWAVDNLRHAIPYNSYTIPPHQFTYYGFDWIRPISMTLTIGNTSIDGMSLLFLALAGLAALIVFGFCFRIASLLFGLGYVYWFMLDKAYYLNHYYLCAILAAMMPMLPANRAFSIDVWLKPDKRRLAVPTWCLWILRFQIGVPYFFGGIAKLNSDWLRGQPMRTTLSYMNDHPWVSKFPLDQEVLVQCICWGGLVFDLLIVPLLLFRRTRCFGFVLVCAFHISNHNLWNIGVFPWLMMAATTVFFDSGWPRQLLQRLRWKAKSAEPAVHSSSLRPSFRQRLITACFSVWVMIQVAVPLRVFFVPGNPSWSEYAHHFSWHMLLRAKVSGLRIYATDPDTGRSGTIDLRQYLTLRQLSVVGRDPRMIHQLCLYISDDLKEQGFDDVELRALALVSLNGRKAQPIIDPAVDLASEKRSLAYPDWIVDLYEPYRHDAWSVPLEQWEARLQLELPKQMILAGEPTSSSEKLAEEKSSRAP